jgi:serine/threonine protein kinase
VARIGHQVAQALAYAHQQGVQHRDVKLGNLLLDAHGTVWVAGFGLAKASDSGDLTKTGEVPRNDEERESKEGRDRGADAAKKVLLPGLGAFG